MAIAAARQALAKPQTQRVLILAQDPSVPVLAEVEIPYEEPLPGPWGYRVRIIDYDASTGSLLPPSKSAIPYRSDARVADLVADPDFHAQNVYAIVMRTLGRFEFALGRRVAWSFDGHQLFAAPHAFADANAFYSKEQRGLFFGYFKGTSGRKVLTCLSHDIVAHETTHALVDGLRKRFTYPSSPDQAAFHEGIADIVALLSIFSIQEVVRYGLIHLGTERPTRSEAGELINKQNLTAERLKDSILLGLGEQFGKELGSTADSRSKADDNRRKKALRQSVKLPPDPNLINKEEFQEPHRRGEILVAAVMNSFLHIWLERIKQLGTFSGGKVHLGRVIEDGAIAANHLLTMTIRALDYTPPTDLLFGDYLSALLTADAEIQPDEAPFFYRRILLKSFAEYGIKPTSKRRDGQWSNPLEHSRVEGRNQPVELQYQWTHFESMQRDRDEVFRFIWQNREALDIYPEAYTQVLSVRPCTRVSSDGFTLHETVAEYLQMITVKASELAGLDWYFPKDFRTRKFPVPKGMPPHLDVTLYGGGTLIFDDYGRLKYHVRNRVLHARRQSKRLLYLWNTGFFNGSGALASFATMHRMRWTDDQAFFPSTEVHHAESF